MFTDKKTINPNFTHKQLAQKLGCKQLKDIEIVLKRILHIIEKTKRKRTPNHLNRARVVIKMVLRGMFPSRTELFLPKTTAVKLMNVFWLKFLKNKKASILIGRSNTTCKKDKKLREETIRDLKDYKSQSILTQAIREEFLTTLPAVKRRYNILGDEIMELDTENIILKNKTSAHHQKCLLESKERHLVEHITKEMLTILWV